jgi:hypothetical protein
MEDFAIAADSQANSLMLFTQGGSLYYTGYDSTRATVTGSAQLLQSAIDVGDGVTTHYYRPYAVVALYTGRFMVVYGKGARLVYRLITLPVNGIVTLSVGGETFLSPVGVTSYFPSVASSSRSTVVAWFTRTAADNHRLVAAVFNRSPSGIDIASRKDFEIADDAVGFTEVGSSWYPWHYFKAPGLAVDSAGNIVVGYDDGFHAKVALVGNSAVRHDSGAFVSKVLRIAHPILGRQFISGVDSAEFDPPFISDTTDVKVELALATDTLFSGVTRNFSPVTASFRTASPFFKYRVKLFSTDSNHFNTPRLRELSWTYRTQPRPPSLDSIKIGAASWNAYDSTAPPALYRRRDSLQLRFSAFDLDDPDSLTLEIFQAGVSVLSLASGEKPSPGRFNFSITLPPYDTSASELNYSLRITDPGGWVSKSSTFRVRLLNEIPTLAFQVLRHSGGAVGRIFDPNGGSWDTLPGLSGNSDWVHGGDTVRFLLTSSDGNDPSLNWRARRGGTLTDSGSLASGGTVEINSPIPASESDQANAPQSWILEISDPDTTLTANWTFNINRLPIFDSLELAGYLPLDSVWIDEVQDRLVDFASDSGLLIPLNRPSIIRAYASDPDIGDTATLSFDVLKKGEGCSDGEISCYEATIQSAADTLFRALSQSEEYLRLRVVDARQAFRETLVRLEYPFLDTADQGGFGDALTGLTEGVRFVLTSAAAETTLTVLIESRGTLPLVLTEALTGEDVSRYLDIRLERVGGTPLTLEFENGTHRSPLTVTSPLTLPPGTSLRITFRFFSDNLDGDALYTVTLVLKTNDLAQPYLRLPFQMDFRDLPGFAFSMQASALGPPASAPDLLPLVSRLRFSFSESVRLPNSENGIVIYSR